MPKGRLFNFGFIGFAGLGIFTNKYDAETNPSNLAISSTVNINGKLRIYSKINLNPFSLEYSYGLNHFSSGLVKDPNIGINVLNNSFSVDYFFEKKPDYQSLKSEKNERSEN